MIVSSFWEQIEDSEGVPPSGRWFGLALALAFGWIGCAPARHGGELRWWAAAVSAALALIAAFRPDFLDPAVAAWWRTLRPVRQGAATLMMALLFFLVITPTGWLRRLFVQDPLGLRFDPHATTYWRTRQPIPPESMNNRF